MRSTRKVVNHPTPTWLNDTVYVPKRQHTIELVTQAVDTLVEQRKQGSTIRISLNTIVAATRLLDPAGKGIAHTTILENEEAYAYYKRYRTASKPAKRQRTQRKANTGLGIKVDRDQARVRQRYMKCSKKELVDQLLQREQEYAQLYQRHLTMNDKVLEWQLRAEQAETQLDVQKKMRIRKK